MLNVITYINSRHASNICPTKLVACGNANVVGRSENVPCIRLTTYHVEGQCWTFRDKANGTILTACLRVTDPCWHWACRWILFAWLLILSIRPTYIPIDLYVKRNFRDTLNRIRPVKMLELATLAKCLRLAQGQHSKDGVPWLWPFNKYCTEGHKRILVANNRPGINDVVFIGCQYRSTAE